MSLRVAVQCLAGFLIALSLASPGWGSESSPADCGGTGVVETESPDALSFLQTGELKSDTSCCTQQEIDSCYASATPENGCFVSYVGCSRFSTLCFCSVLCPH